MADYSWLSMIQDRATYQALKRIMDRLAKNEKLTVELDLTTLKTGSPVNAHNARVANAQDPQHAQDLVTLAYIRRYVATQLSVSREQAAIDGGDPNELQNENGPIGAGSAPPTVPLAELGGDVDAYIAAHPADFANHCISSGGSWAFMTGLVAYLQGIDPRVGGNGKRGNTSDPSTDAVSYYHGVLPPIVGSNDVFVVDVISASCSPTASGSWQNVTTSAAAGAWLPSVP